MSTHSNAQRGDGGQRLRPKLIAVQVEGRSTYISGSAIVKCSCVASRLQKDFLNS